LPYTFRHWLDSVKFEVVILL